MTLRSPARDPSLARLASAVTVLPRALSKSLLLMSRARKKEGGGPSRDQVWTCSPLFVSTINSICGFLQSTLLRVPLRLTRSLKSNKADMLWCAHAVPARSRAAQTTKTAVRWLMRILLVGIIRSSVQIVSRKKLLSNQETRPQSYQFAQQKLRMNERRLDPIVSRIDAVICIFYPHLT